jgi:hypothetical protein
MKIQPMLELKGIRIELTVEEAEQIARSPVSGAERIQKEVAIVIDLHHSGEQAEIIPAAPGPHIRLDGTHPAKEAKQIEDKKKITAQEKSPRIECEFCGGLFHKRGMLLHQRTCEAKDKVEDRSASTKGILSDFVPDKP